MGSRSRCVFYTPCAPAAVLLELVFLVFFCLYLYIPLSLFTVYLWVAALSQDFPGLVDEVSLALFTSMAYRHCCCLRTVFLAYLLLNLLCGFGLSVFPIWGFFSAMKFQELVQKKKKMKRVKSNILVWLYHSRSHNFC
jgi:hypothetical protein